MSDRVELYIPLDTLQSCNPGTPAIKDGRTRTARGHHPCICQLNCD